MPDATDTTPDTWTCPLCLHTSAHLKQDRRGGRYLACTGCGSRTFIKGSTFGLAVLHALATTLGGRRLRGLNEQLGSAVVVGAIAQTLRGAAQHFNEAIREQINNRAWEELSMQMDEFLDPEQNGQPER